MRIAPFALLAALVLLPAPPSRGATLPVNASFQLLAGSLPPPTLSGSGVGSSVGGGLATLPAGVFSGNPAVIVPVSPPFVGLTQLSIPASSVGNPAGSFNPGGAMGLSGSVFFQPGPGLFVPLAPIGGGGTAMFIVPGGIGVTVAGATWMGGTQVFTAMGSAVGNPVSVQATAYDNRTVNGVGTLQLVAPASMKFGGGVIGQFGAFGVLTLQYTPEPGTLVLLGLGAVGLAALARRKRERAARG